MASILAVQSYQLGRTMPEPLLVLISYLTLAYVLVPTTRSLNFQLHDADSFCSSKTILMFAVPFEMAEINSTERPQIQLLHPVVYSPWLSRQRNLDPRG